MPRKDFPDGTRIQEVRVSPYVLARMVQIINPSFETADLAGWKLVGGKVTVTSEEAQDGNYSAKFHEGFISRLQQYVTVLGSKISELRFWWCSPADVAATIIARIYYTDGTKTEAEFTAALIKIWEQHGLAPDTTKTIQSIMFENKTKSDYGWLDVVELVLA